MSMEKEGLWVEKGTIWNAKKVRNIIMYFNITYAIYKFVYILITLYTNKYTYLCNCIHSMESNHIPRKVWGEITVPLMFRNG